MNFKLGMDAKLYLGASLLNGTTVTVALRSSVSIAAKRRRKTWRIRSRAASLVTRRIESATSTMTSVNPWKIGSNSCSGTGPTGTEISKRTG